MGRWAWSDRNTVEDCRVLSISKLTKDGVFTSGPGSSWSSRWYNHQGKETGSIGYWVNGEHDGNLSLEFEYTITKASTGEVIPVHYKVDIEKTPCNYGGWRYWFICPLGRNGIACQRRIAKIYLPPGGKYFGCRHCYNLTYECQKEHDKQMDILLKDPKLIEYQLKRGNFKAATLVLKAVMGHNRFYG